MLLTLIKLLYASVLFNLFLTKLCYKLCHEESVAYVRKRLRPSDYLRPDNIKLIVSSWYLKLALKVSNEKNLFRSRKPEGKLNPNETD